MNFPVVVDICTYSVQIMCKRRESGVVERSKPGKMRQVGARNAPPSRNAEGAKPPYDHGSQGGHEVNRCRVNFLSELEVSMADGTAPDTGVRGTTLKQSTRPAGRTSGAGLLRHSHLRTNMAVFPNTTIRASVYPMCLLRAGLWRLPRRERTRRRLPEQGDVRASRLDPRITV
jgi:hypothetical protein